MSPQNLTVEQCEFLLELLRREYGPGYAEHPEVRRLQAQLSMLAELATRQGWRSAGDFPKLGLAPTHLLGVDGEGRLVRAPVAACPPELT